MVDDRFGFRDALRSLSGEPAGTWPAGAIHHGARVLVLLALAAVVFVLFPVSPIPDFPMLERGMVAEEDLIAQHTFPIPKSETELARERSEAAAGVAPMLDYDAAAVEAMLEQVEAFLARVDSVAVNVDSEAELRRGMAQLLRSYGFVVEFEPRLVELLRLPANRALLRDALSRAIREELPAGIARSAAVEGSAAPQLRVRRNGEERLLPRDSLVTASRFFERASRHLPQGIDPNLAELHGLVLVRFFEPSLSVNREATEAARERARQAVPSVKGEVLRGERIVRAHEQVREPELERLRAYQEYLSRLGELGEDGSGGLRSAGAYLYNLLLLLIFGVLLYYFRPAIYHELRHVLLIAAVVLAFIAATAIIGRTGAPNELIPIAFPALVIAALWDGRLALNLALVLGVLLAGQAPFVGISVLFTTVIAGAAAAFSVRVVRRRAQTWVFISIIVAAYVMAALTLGLLRSWDLGDIVWSAGWGTMNAIGSSLIAMGFLPLFETFTRITTDQTLLELSDLNRPLLKRLSLEAPGTYAHSISVANLAESAARAIGANALLTRVGIYYHDVGKMVKPQYFIENQPPGRNPHDKLKPSTSAAIVRGHIIEGLRLVEEAKLPDDVKAFVAEHHGTQSISFFYDKARELDPAADLNPDDFRYPGPRPRSKETAIAMLADSVESAARALQDPTPERVRALVDRIVEDKIVQGQLDDTPLTLGEISIIRDQLASVLSGMYHHRIDYPTPTLPPERARIAAPRSEPAPVSPRDAAATRG